MKDKSSSKPLQNLSREELNAQLEALRQPSQSTNSTDNRRSFFRSLFGKLVGIGAVLGMTSGCDKLGPQPLCYMPPPEEEPVEETEPTEDKTEEMKIKM